MIIHGAWAIRAEENDAKRRLRPRPKPKPTPSSKSRITVDEKTGYMSMDPSSGATLAILNEGDTLCVKVGSNIKPFTVTATGTLVFKT